MYRQFSADRSLRTSSRWVHVCCVVWKLLVPVSPLSTSPHLPYSRKRTCRERKLLHNGGREWRAMQNTRTAQQPFVQNTTTIFVLHTFRYYRV